MDYHIEIYSLQMKYIFLQINSFTKKYINYISDIYFLYLFHVMKNNC